MCFGLRNTHTHTHRKGVYFNTGVNVHFPNPGARRNSNLRSQQLKIIWTINHIYVFLGVTSVEEYIFVENIGAWTHEKAKLLAGHRGRDNLYHIAVECFDQCACLRKV